ncbi:MAG: hypothetical protein JWN40_5042 [Phycisphaerales bacterium]|nr:hypothetical protein [Phycisphaerales bacterium]
MSDLDHPSAQSSASVCAPIPAVTPADPAPDPMHQNASGCIIPTECENSLTHLNTPVPVPAPVAPAPNHPLTQKQYDALDFLLDGSNYDDDYICTRLRIHRTTLYRWKHQHPLFMTELHRRREQLWNDVAGDLHFAATRAIETLRDQLSHLSDNTTRLRAARTVLQLVRAHRVPPAAANPTNLNDILDKLLHQQQPTAPNAAGATFTDAQRQTLLDRLLKEDAAAQAQDEAEALARRQARLARKAETPRTTTIEQKEAIS